jgi:hypothetical protein
MKASFIDEPESMAVNPDLRPPSNWLLQPTR